MPLIATSESDVQNKRNVTHLRFPNKRMMSFPSGSKLLELRKPSEGRINPKVVRILKILNVYFFEMIIKKFGVFLSKNRLIY